MPESYQCRQSFFDQSHSRDVITKQSCGAAIRVKPRARLCEPWVQRPKSDRAPKSLSEKEPRSGERSVAHGVSHGIRATRITQPRRGETHRPECSAAPRLMCRSRFLPTAHAVGYRTTAAPRLCS